ncbi:MAG: peptidylprolyl isomerase [Syntrophobacterales bacterium]|jgi:peptidyl-prolyl cis-trans isomerase SurA|nr:peptidylprolyl isomerase [Syntrophobacterales bacterium]
MSILLSVFIALSLFWPALSQGEVIDRVVAIVNDDIITLKETEKYVPIEKKDKFVSINEYLQGLRLKEKMDFMIDDLLIRQQAKKLNVFVSDKDADAIVDNIKKQHLITEEDLKQQLAKEHINYTDFYEGLKSNLLRTRVLTRIISPDVTITEADLKDYYNKHLDEFKDEDYKLQHIFISGKRSDIKDRAIRAYNLLKEGESFEAVAKEFSDDPSADNGGDIGFVRKEDLVPEFRGAVTFLTPGTYSKIVQSAYGVHILKLIEVKAGGTLPYEAVKVQIQEKIVSDLSQKRYKEFIEKLRKSSYIEVKI